ncbi:hypothetical protein L198_01929 [Cryptococcus wingfieldii CBS 7118]|uniref:SMP-LTD domain-containing protein n=1 Tax=Cryptococcus wingfieldii CBS 7118 TaxID=1295528 RepID=A0A1E3JWK1_9TREE|nr:hypothetical protein L198_01929 [Cryptococcus wingfieldii CBS 7118]ODO05239.1 hypothetical protein L198_01929 [Cryptococcus wingfieldii CBS 7118]
MWWPFQWLIVYLCGGLTFLPLALTVVLVYVYQYGTTPIGDKDPYKFQKATLQHDAERAEQLQKQRYRAPSSTSPTVSGWITVRNTFNPDGWTIGNGKPGGESQVTGTSTPVTESPSEELAEEESWGKANTPSSGEQTPGSADAQGGKMPYVPYTTRIAQTYRTILPRQTKAPIPRQYFFGVLKSSVLYLYEDEAQINCLHAIAIDDYSVGIEMPSGMFEGKDGEMFAKRHGIVLKIRKPGKGMPLLSKSMEATQTEFGLANSPIYLFSKSNTKMEDWYIALLHVSTDHLTWDQVFAVDDMKNLVDTIDTEPDPIPMRWFNAMLGRVFFGYYKTETFEQFIITKIMKKISKVTRPGYLGPIVVREVNVGTSPPLFSKPMLKNLEKDGSTAFEVHVQHRSRASQPGSDIRLTIATTVTIPTGFKPYVVEIVLAVVLKSIEGNMRVEIKGPPSNRIWYGFTEMPKMEMEIIPIVSERKIQLGMVLNAIEKQLKDAIAESVVLPNMDDLAFFDTSSLPIRGGIFDLAAKVERNATGEKVEPPVEAPVVSKEDPDSAVPTTTSIRQRQKKKSQLAEGETVFPAPASQSSTDSGPPIPRTDTAPPAIATANSSAVKKAAALAATKKWFAQTGPKSPSLAAQAMVGSQGAAAAASSSSAPALGIPKDSSEKTGNWENQPEVAPVEVSSSTTPSAESIRGHNNNGSITSMPGQTVPSGPSSVKGFDTSSTLSGSSTETANPTAPQASTASLISSFRSRDKKAIQAQVGSARDQVKKWGVSFAARRKATREGGDLGAGDEVVDMDEAGLRALYRPREEEEDARDDEPLPVQPLSVGSQRSLQARLNAAAHDTGASPLPRSRSPSGQGVSIPGRNRSHSSSKHSLFSASPRAASPRASASTSPSQWIPTAGMPTTGIAKDDHAVGSPGSSISASGTQGHSRRHSNATAISLQPTSGRSMVVPRVPKRPGQVMGFGSDMSSQSGEIGSSLKKADEDKGAEHAEPEVLTVGQPPELPPRKSTDGVSDKANDTLVSRSVPPPRPSSLTSLPPPLPGRKPSPADSDRSRDVTHSGISSTPGALSPPRTSPNRPNPVPDKGSLIDGKSSDPSPPSDDTLISSVRRSESRRLPSESTSASPAYGAQESLRLVAQRHEEAKKANLLEIPEKDEAAKKEDGEGASHSGGDMLP